MSESATRAESPRNAQAEARERLGDDDDVRVLEPSPPAVRNGNFADDPTAEGDVPTGRRLITPIEGRGDTTWDALVND